jgi:hypothetical protein
VKETFIEPMLLQRTARLPEGPGWQYEVKWDGYSGDVAHVDASPSADDWPLEVGIKLGARIKTEKSAWQLEC